MALVLHTHALCWSRVAIQLPLEIPIPATAQHQIDVRPDPEQHVTVDVGSQPVHWPARFTDTTHVLILADMCTKS